MPPEPSFDLSWVAVEDPADPRLVDYLDLTDVQLRRRLEPEEGLFLAEGANVVSRALRAGFRPRSLLLLRDRAARDDVRRTADAVKALGAPVYVADADVLVGLTGYDVHRGVLAAFARKPLPPVDDVLHGARRVVVLEDVVDHTNLGAAFRSAAGLGVDAVLVTPRCADPLYRRAVRVSMGTVLAVPWTRLTTWPADLELLSSAGFVTAALALVEDAITLDALADARHERLALVLGTEGSGLRASTLAVTDVRVRIPMSAGVDSLNVAAAAAVACYATRIQP